MLYEVITPVAAALVLKGLSPGAALVFLLAGPATNAATITVVVRYFGKMATLIYLTTIAICSLLLGWLTNRIYSWLDLDITHWVSDIGDATDSILMQGAAIVLVLLIRITSYNVCYTKLLRHVLCAFLHNF